MQGKTPSAPVVPGALTADQKKTHPNSCCQTKAKQWGQRKVTHKFERERKRVRGREGWKCIAPMKAESETNL